MVNVFHCCVQKTASQWIRKVFSDPRCVRASGLSPFNFYENINDAEQKPRLSPDFHFDTPFPNDTVVTPLYINYSSFCSIPKPALYKAFFVVRDPRDLVVSWYFSARYSHDQVDEIQPHRNSLGSLSTTEGLIFSIRQLASAQYFSSIHSWLEAPKQDDNIKIFKFEELTAPAHTDIFEALFDHCGIKIPKSTLEAVLKRYSFRQMAQRHQGVEDASSHYRKGLVGDWVHYFDESVEEVFRDETGDLLERLGYQTSRYEAVKEQLGRTQVHLELATHDYHALRQETCKLVDQVQYSLASVGEASSIFADRETFKRIPSDYLRQLESITAKLSGDLGSDAEKARSAAQQQRLLKQRLEESRQKVQQLRQRLRDVTEEANRGKNFRLMVQSSRFWKLRSRWIVLKKVFQSVWPIA